MKMSVTDIQFCEIRVTTTDRFSCESAAVQSLTFQRKHGQQPAARCDASTHLGLLT